MNKITNEQLDALIKSAVNSSGPLPPDEKFSQIISALRELRELRAAMLQGSQPVSNRDELADSWVACSERMPGSQEWVIVFAKWANQQVLCWDDFENRWTDFDDQSYVHDMFTHWMPLPVAPQQEAE